jgi:hypothetical protein
VCYFSSVRAGITHVPPEFLLMLFFMHVIHFRAHIPDVDPGHPWWVTTTLLFCVAPSGSVVRNASWQPAHRHHGTFLSSQCPVKPPNLCEGLCRLGAPHLICKIRSGRAWTIRFSFHYAMCTQDDPIFLDTSNLVSTTPLPRYYAGRLIRAEFSPVTDFREARCRAFHESRCNRGG